MKIAVKLSILLFILSACSADRSDLIDAINDPNNTPVEELAKDTDGDGVIDSDEVVDNTNINDSCSFILSNQTVTPTDQWNNKDCDSDGVKNALEIIDSTDPINSDTDNDGINDGDEKKDGTNPLNDDTDEDGVKDGVEKSDKTNPLKNDTDGDGVVDGQEKADTTDPLDNCSFVLENQEEEPDAIWNSADCDNDGLSNSTEKTNGTDPLVYNQPTPEVAAIAGTWNLTQGVIDNGTATTLYQGETFNLTYTAISSNENVQVSFSENPNTVTSTGTYTMVLNFTFLGSDYQDTTALESPFSNGNWSINNNILTIDANANVNGNYEIIEITENSLKLSTPVNREVPAGGLDLNVQGTLILTFTK